MRSAIPLRRTRQATPSVPRHCSRRLRRHGCFRVGTGRLDFVCLGRIGPAPRDAGPSSEPDLRLSPHPAQATSAESGNPKAYDPSLERPGRPQVHSPRPLAAASSLSIGWVSSLSSVGGVTWPRQRAFAPRHMGLVSGRLSTMVSSEGLALLSWFPAAFRLPAFAFWSSCARPGVGPSSRSAYRPKTGPRRGFRVPHA